MGIASTIILSMIGLERTLAVAGSIATAGLLAVALAAGSAAVGCGFAVAGAAFGKALPGEKPRRLVSAAAAVGILGFGLYGLASAA